jgi:hypothetical protein
VDRRFDGSRLLKRRAVLVVCHKFFLYVTCLKTVLPSAVESRLLFSNHAKKSLFTCIPSSNNPWFGLAYAAALLGGPCQNSTALLRPSKEAIKVDIRQFILSIWDQEWSNSSHGANTSAFSLVQSRHQSFIGFTYPNKLYRFYQDILC